MSEISTIDALLTRLRLATGSVAAATLLAGLGAVGNYAESAALEASILDTFAAQAARIAELEDEVAELENEVICLTSDLENMEAYDET